MEKNENEHFKKRNKSGRTVRDLYSSSHVDLSNIQDIGASLCDSFNSLRVDISFSYSHSLSLNQNLE